MEDVDLAKAGLHELIDRIVRAERSFRWADAEALYRLWLEHRPDEPLARYGLSLILLRDGRYDEGFKMYEGRTGL